MIHKVRYSRHLRHLRAGCCCCCCYAASAMESDVMIRMVRYNRHRRHLVPDTLDCSNSMIVGWSHMEGVLVRDEIEILLTDGTFNHRETRIIDNK